MVPHPSHGRTTRDTQSIYAVGKCVRDNGGPLGERHKGQKNHLGRCKCNDRTSLTQHANHRRAEKAAVNAVSKSRASTRFISGQRSRTGAEISGNGANTESYCV